ncbi:Bifunctional purine biosynthesis protein PurH [Coemansia thaxteri]|nr:Bifunctional purine biosynthesis protein PurH [Coemansia thaxteri]
MSQSIGITKYQLFCVVAASAGPINFGWNFGVTNLPGDAITKCINGPAHLIGGLPSCIPTSDTIWGLVVGCFALGCLTGALASPHYSNIYGRKTVLIYSNVPAIAAAIILALAVDLAMLILARILVGVAMGASVCTFATYVVEITTPRARNSLGAMTQFGIIFGIMLSQTTSLGLSNSPLWRVLFAMTGALSLASMAVLRSCVESPKWLAMKGHLAESREALQRLRGDADCTTEFAQIASIVSCSSSGTEMVSSNIGAGDGCPKTCSVIEVLLGRTPDNLRHQLLVAATIMLAQQASGIGGVSFFSYSLFSSVTASNPSGSTSSPTLAQILTSVMAITGTLTMPISMVLAVYFGRRPLLIISHVLMGLCCVLISVGSIVGASSLTITMVFIYFSAFMIGAGPIPWIVPSEMTPTYAVAAIGAISSCVGYVCIFAIGLAFAPLLKALGGYTFLLFGAMNILAALFFYVYLPETKDRQVAEVVSVHSVGIHSVLRAKYRIEQQKDPEL